MKISSRAYDFDHGALLNDLECSVCEGPLSWELEDDYDAPSWASECCNKEYRLHIKSVRSVVTG